MAKAVFEYGKNTDASIPCKFSRGHHPHIGAGTPNWHEHPEILYCEKGIGTVRLENRSFPFRPGNCVIVNSQVIHSVISEKELWFSCIHPYVGFCRENGIPADSFTFREHIETAEDIGAVIRRLELHWNSDAPLKNAHINHDVLELMLLCEKYTEPGSAMTRNTPAFQRVRRVMVFLKSNLDRAVTLDEISDVAQINKYQLSREFRALTGKTVFQFINVLRCKEAERQLYHGASVSQAAFGSGFQNLSYFSRTYQKIIGELPVRTKQKSEK